MTNSKIIEIKKNINKVIVGNDTTIDILLAALISGGHVLLEDVPGTGKTVLAKSLAKSISADFSRIQFTPDLLPADICGIYYYNKKDEDFVFRAGPVFANIILGDEINRATPRTQSALLECMAEKQVTIENTTHKLSEPFFVIATENPLEASGTFPLPEAQLDRFLVKLSMEKPDRAKALEILERFDHSNPLDNLTPVCTTEDIISMIKEASTVRIASVLSEYILDIIDETEKHPDITTGASTRAALALASIAKAYAYVKGRDYVVPEDIKLLAPKVLAHRLVLNHGRKWQTNKAENIVEGILGSLTVPTENWG